MIIKKIILFIIALSLFIGISSFSTVSNQINAALKQGNATKLTEFMNQTIELDLLNNENVYSKVQAGQVLKKFFSENKPTDFRIIHNGQKENTQYFIGTLSTGSKSFRVYYLLKKNGSQKLIYQLRIENNG